LSSDGIQITRKATDLIKDVANSLSSLLSIGDGPRAVQTSSIVIRVERNTPSSFNKKVIGDRDRVQITLPPSGDVLSNTNSTPKLMTCQVSQVQSNRILLCCSHDYRMVKDDSFK
jgi:hypothetical protein